MKKGKTIETPLPEAMIQHIQSFLSGKEAARSALISKPWHTAWLTRPSLHFDDRDFINCRRQKPWSTEFEDYALKTLQRYRDSRLKIDSFSLHLLSNRTLPPYFAVKLVAGSVQIGATDVELEFLPKDSFTVPRELVASKTLLKLSLTNCTIGGYNCDVDSFSSLKSLSLNNVHIISDVVLDDILSRSAASFEELLLHAGSLGYGGVSRMHLYEFHKLRRLSLSRVDLGEIFSSGFASRFPCLQDLSINQCFPRAKIQIGSTSLRTISLRTVRGLRRANFDVPNIRKFIYSGSSSPAHNLSIKASASREWEFDITITISAGNQLHKSSWFLNLKKFVSKFRLSRMSLSIKLSTSKRFWLPCYSEHEVDNIDIVAQPSVVENLMVEALPFYCRALVFRLFGICRPKFLTLYRSIDCYETGDALDGLCKRLMPQQSNTTNCNWSIPDQSMFGKFGLRKVKVEVDETNNDTDQWLPLAPNTSRQYRCPAKEEKIRFQLMWED